jgi:hypothetical protein
VIADIYGIHTFPDSVKTRKGWVGLDFDSVYAALGGVKIIHQQTTVIPNSNSVSIKFSCEIPEQYQKFILSNPAIKAELFLGVFDGKHLLHEYKTGITAVQLANRTNAGAISFFVDDSNKQYEARFGIKTNNYLTTHNSEKILIPKF